MSLTSIINELIVDNVESSIKFYIEKFNFELVESEGIPTTWAKMKKDDVIIMLEDYNNVKNTINNYQSKVNSCNLIKFEYNNIQEIKELYNKLKDSNIEFFMEYTETNYGKAEFGIFDLDKNMILISAVM